MSNLKRLEVDSITFSDNYIDIAWVANIGFGHLGIWFDKETNKYKIDTECLGEAFAKKVLAEATKFLLKNSDIVD